MTWQQNLPSVLTRLLAIAVVVGAAIYGLTGLKALRSGSRGPTDLHRSSGVADAAATPSPDQLLSSMGQEGFWAFPTGYWTIGQRDMVIEPEGSPQDVFLASLADMPEEVDDLDPNQHFESLVPLFMKRDSEPLQVGEVTIYRLQFPIGLMGIACRNDEGRPRVVGGGLLVKSQETGWRVYQLYANPLRQAADVPLTPELEEDAEAQLLAARFDGQRRRIAEFVRLPGKPLALASQHALASEQASVTLSENQIPIGRSWVSRGTSNGRAVYSWQVSRPDGTFKLVVDAKAIDGER